MVARSVRTKLQAAPIAPLQCPMCGARVKHRRGQGLLAFTLTVRIIEQPSDPTGVAADSVIQAIPDHELREFALAAAVEALEHALDEHEDGPP